VYARGMAPRRKPRIPGKAVAYIRTSTDRQGNSVNDQRHRIEAYCTARGWTLAGVYVDEGVSGAKASRPALDRMVADVLGNGVSAVVSTKLDRLGRSVAHVIELVDQLEAKGVAMVLVDQSIDTSTPAGRLLRNVLASVAEFERDLISERVKAGMAEAKRSKGRRYGKTSQLPDELVGRIGAMRAGGASLATIARTLNAEQVQTGQGGQRWYPSTVSAVLSSRRGPEMPQEPRSQDAEGDPSREPGI
jgi:DNA invertase Pin-like site-specific DNA recombinase